jgi:antitoxin component YwqK of YwqJK toxin-antitoxin module
MEFRRFRIGIFCCAFAGALMKPAKAADSLKTYYGNGQLRTLRITSAPEERITESFFFNNGKLSAHKTFQRGNPVDTARFWYPDGTRRGEIPYRMGSIDGWELTWYPNSALKSRRFWKLGRPAVLEQSFFDTGNLERECRYGTNSKCSQETILGPSGDTVSFFRPYGKGFQILEEWGSSGVVTRRAKLRDSVLDGEEARFYPVGKPQSTAYYRDGKISGKSRTWFPNGSLQCETNFSAGDLHGMSQCFYESGSRKSQGSFKNGKPVGIHRKWYENQKLESQTSFSDGNRHGAYREWYNTGELHYEIIFKNGLLASGWRFSKEGMKEAIGKGSLRIGPGAGHPSAG